MIISQIVLTLFVGQWVWSVYVKERDRVDQEFSRRFRDSGVTVMDSLLVVKVLNPMLNDTSYRRLTMNITLDSFPVDAARWNGTGIPGRNKQARYYSLQSNEQIILQGMKLFVERIEDSLSPTGGFMRQTVIMHDTGRLKQVFAGTIREVDPSIRIRWTTDTPPWQTKILTPGRFYYEFPANGYTLGATISNPFRLIFKQMIPSILFALFLLILTGLSFVIAFRSLKSQIQLNHIRSDFLSNITHELKTPVATVKVALEALKKFNPENDPATSSEYLELAIREMDRLENLVGQVLNSSMYDNGILTIGKERISLLNLTDEVIGMLRSRLDDLGGTVAVMQESGPDHIIGDRLHLEGVLVNLLENCMNYGGEHPQIVITIGREARGISLSVADNGPGIPEEYIGRVFDRFFRVPGGDFHNVKGYGLGLSYASMIMKLHGGSIRAENMKEGGVRFILTFPHPAP
ncbi:MAG: HAMP domain-containing histidine kinase [Bacteroidales bacterium]|nr:HAMP domain-containing histidine kinase [Bacteroidales bacterium]